MIVLDMISMNQNVPVVLENLRLSTINKTVFQAFYVEWLTTDYQYSKPVYLGAGLMSAGCASPFPRLNYVPFTGNSKSPVRTYIHDTVFV